ncbi:unnamed protein product [Trypanosoma congolense IL3000]|uniref:WGS project CAEQ00000000 data, annotated contig 888 n=1 Tax=Trypanosoma congolense (strain IL3000) TaxID=1068625 RepID=F9WJ93_TRYCI|nr:unnamed protein product [Trypanosoma congolense IL3000]
MKRPKKPFFDVRNMFRTLFLLSQHIFYKKNISLVTPATSTWCQGLVLRLGGSQAPAICPVRKDGGGQEADGYQRGSMQHHRHSGVNEVGRILPCTCGRATLDARRILLLVSGDIERNPGPMIRGAQWNAGGLSQVKRIALERKLHEDMVLFCLLQETHLASAESASLTTGGYQHVGQARIPHGGVGSILVRDGVGVEVGILEKEVPERATVTLRFSADVSLTIISAYFPRKADVSSWALDTLLGANGAMVIGADVNSHHVLWDPLRPSDDKGECIVDWCVQNDMRIANTGLATRRQPGTAALSSPDITLCRDCEISNWKSALSPDSDHHWITFDVFVGTSLDVIAPSKPVRALYSWNKARWNDFKKLSDDFIYEE